MPRSFLCAVLFALTALSVGVDAQVGAPRAGVASAAAHPTVHHGFPLAGESFSLVVDGLEPGGPVVARLVDALAAPPSLQEHPAFVGLGDPLSADRQTVLLADALGRLTLDVTFDHPEDPGRLIKLLFTDVTSGADVQAKLLVQPPMALLPTDAGLARIELFNGMPLVPHVPLEDTVLGASLSTDGLRFQALLTGGVLQERSAHTWSGPALGERVIHPRGDDLVTSTATGPAFIVVRPEGEPFAPRGRLVPLEVGRPTLEVDPLALAVAGRRWAVTDDGLTAYVAEDDLIVREVDLLGWAARTPFTAGFHGDEVVADLAVVGDHLLVLSRRPRGLPGSLTVLDLTTGSVTPFALDIDPRVVVGISEGTALVLPADGGLLQVVEGGVPTRRDAVGPLGDSVLDGTMVADAQGAGALLLLSDVSGATRLARWTSDFGVRDLAVESPMPLATTLVSGGHDLALMLGAADGSVYRVVPSRGHVELIEGVRTRLGATHLSLP